MTSGTDGYYEHVEKYIKLAKSSFRFFHKMLQKNVEELFWPTQYYGIISIVIITNPRSAQN